MQVIVEIQDQPVGRCYITRCLQLVLKKKEKIIIEQLKNLLFSIYDLDMGKWIPFESMCATNSYVNKQFYLPVTPTEFLRIKHTTHWKNYSYWSVAHCVKFWCIH